MQIQGMNTTSSMQQMQQPPSQPLSEEQENALQDILSNYDLENISQEELDQLHAEMEEAGIPRSRETMQAMTEAGLDFSTMAPPEGPPPGGMPPGGEGSEGGVSGISGVEESSETSTVSTLMDLISQIQSGEADESDLESFLGQFKQALTSSVGNMIDQYI